MPRYQVNQLGAVLLPGILGSWYWCRSDRNGLPLEAIDSHGPFLFKFLASRAARKAIGQ